MIRKDRDEEDWIDRVGEGAVYMSQRTSEQTESSIKYRSFELRLRRNLLEMQWKQYSRFISGNCVLQAVMIALEVERTEGE